MSVLDPKCQIENPEKKPAALTADGYILPCCWLDYPGDDKYIQYWDLKNKELLLSNNDNVKDIFTSEQWFLFMDMLKTSNNVSEIPNACLRHCSKK